MVEGDFSVAQLFSLPSGGTEIALMQHLSTIDAEIAQQIAKHLDIPFLAENGASNLCFAYDNTGLSSEFKQSFVAADLADYIYGLLNHQDYGQRGLEFLNIDSLRIPFPEDTEYFWKYVAMGGEIRKTFYHI